MSYSEPPPPTGPPNPPQPPYGSSQGPYAAQPAGKNKKAIWSLVLGILGLCCCGFITGIPAIILGRSAKSEITATGQSGMGLATAGFVLGILAVIWGIVGIILYATGALTFDGTFTTS